MVMVESRVMVGASSTWIWQNSEENADVTEFGEFIAFGEWERETSWIYYLGFWLKRLGEWMAPFSEVRNIWEGKCNSGVKVI